MIRLFIILSLLATVSGSLLANGLRLPYSSAYLKLHPNKCGFVEFSSHAMMAMALNGEHKAKWSFPENGSPPHFHVIAEGGQNVLRDRGNIDSMKKAMIEGKFEYEAIDARIGGNWDGARSTYIINEGRHRLNAALEVAHETGD